MGWRWLQDQEAFVPKSMDIKTFFFLQNANTKSKLSGQKMDYPWTEVYKRVKESKEEK
jgi:hypothetical protein